MIRKTNENINNNNRRKILFSTTIIFPIIFDSTFNKKKSINDVNLGYIFIITYSVYRNKCRKKRQLNFFLWNEANVKLFSSYIFSFYSYNTQQFNFDKSSRLGKLFDDDHLSNGWRKIDKSLKKKTWRKQRILRQHMERFQLDKILKETVQKFM